MQQHATVPVNPDPWNSVARDCSRDARLVIGGAISKARAAGHTYPSGCSSAAFDALATLYGALMAQNARLTAEVAGMRARTRFSFGSWLRRLFGLSRTHN
jgi:outer membrane murein-binding lipoprotein Lpp